MLLSFSLNGRWAMLKKTRLNNVQRGVETLRGIVAGLVADYKLNDKELGSLTEWLSLHADLLSNPPFKDLHSLIARALRDEVLDTDEREEIIDWCHEFDSVKRFL